MLTTSLWPVALGCVSVTEKGKMVEEIATPKFGGTVSLKSRFSTMALDPKLCMDLG